MKNLIKRNKGHWFYPVSDFVYNDAYIKKYEGYAKTFMGHYLLNVRLGILKPYKNIIDVGIGSGDLEDNKQNAKGYDVNPVAIQKLKDKNQWVDIYTDDLNNFDAICFFDSFEHIEHPSIILNRLTTQEVIITIPIFYNYEYIFKSRHFRPDEHYHYFTFQGLLDYMERDGWECTYISDVESQIGRHDIFTFIFRKIKC